MFFLSVSGRSLWAITEAAIGSHAAQRHMKKGKSNWTYPAHEYLYFSEV
jgi:hypothetical protein